MANKDMTVSEPMTLEEYFKLHPEEEDDFYDALCELHEHDEPIDYPEDW